MNSSPSGKEILNTTEFCCEQFLALLWIQTKHSPCFDSKKLELHVTVRKRFKQSTFRATNNFPAKLPACRRLLFPLLHAEQQTKEIGDVCTQATRETNAKFPYCWPVTTQIWVLLQISWSKFPTRHDQSGSKFCARSSDVFFAGKPVLALRNVSCFVRLGRFTQNRVGNCTNYLRIALGAWPPTTYITLGKPIGVLGRVLGDCTEDRWSFVSKWYFIASIKKSLHMLLFLTSASVSTRLTRYSRDRRGSRTCSINCARQSCLCSGSWLTQATTASNTWKFLKRKLID